VGRLTALILGRGAMSASGLQIRYAAIRDELESARSQREHAERALTELRAAAANAGLAGALRALEHPTPPAVVEREASTSRCRVLEGFSTEHESIPVYAATGDIVDLPATLAYRLAEGGLVEFVGAETPLARSHPRG
jgi:hypothetical protein